MTPEDIGDIFQELEDILFAMAIRNMDAHRAWEEQEGFKWTQWQAEQIKGLREYRKKVNIVTNRGFNTAKKAIKEFLQEAYDGSVIDAAGLAVKAGKGSISPAFFGVNSQKMDILLEEAVKDIDTKRYAVVNRMNSGYTDFLRKADIFAQSGSMTIPQALDYAMKDFLSAGLNCVEYSNGNRVNIASYAEMALRTSSSEVTRQANGDVRDELDEYLVVSNVIGMTCPYCQRWQGRVLIDDVYADGKPDGKHQLVSQAKADHFLHPNCRHQLFMYLEGITEVADLPNDAQTKERYKAEQEQRRQEREIRKYKRLRDGAVDPADRKKYDARVKEWTAKHDQFLSEHDYLRKNPKRLAPGYTGDGKPEGTGGMIKLSRSYFGDDKKLDTYFKKVQPLEGYEDFGFHCDPYEMEFTLNGQTINYTAKEFADILRGDPRYHGGKIRLLACSAGAVKNGFAQQLADELGVEVLAPTETLNLDENGQMFISDNEVLAEAWYNSTKEERHKIRQTGYWKPFEPKQRNDLS